MNDAIELAKGFTVARYRACSAAKDCGAIAELVRARFRERYLDPVTKPPRDLRHGFTTMAICCLMIEALEAFRKGLIDTKGRSKAQFKSFFSKWAAFAAFKPHAKAFYSDVRCGILHEAETRNGWRVRRTGELLRDRCINATRFAKAMGTVLDEYVAALRQGPWDDEVCVHARIKLDAICDKS